MKLIAVFIALLFATAAQAKLYNYKFLATFEYEDLAGIVDELGNDLGDTHITPGNNAYNFRGGWYDDLRSGAAYEGRLVFDSLGGAPTACKIGPVECPKWGNLIFGEFGGVVSAHFGEIGWFGHDFRFDPDGTGSLVTYWTSFGYEGETAEGVKVISEEGGGAYLRLERIPNIPLPASSLLIMGALAVLAGIRGHRHAG